MMLILLSSFGGLDRSYFLKIKIAAKSIYYHENSVDTFLKFRCISTGKAHMGTAVSAPLMQFDV